MPTLRGMHANKTVDDAASRLQELIASGQDLLDNMEDQKGAAAERLREKISDTIDQARDRLRDVGVPEMASEAYDETVGFIRDNPWRMVAIGALAVLAGSVLVRLIADD